MKKIILTAVFVASTIAIGGCWGGNGNPDQKAIIKQDVSLINKQLEELRRNEPLPTFHDSAALHVQDAYYTADADPKKLWYVTIVSMTGQVLDHFTTQGAPQPAGDQVTNPLQQTCATHIHGHAGNCDTIGLAEPNGVHQGQSNDGYVAILTTGAMKRFSCGAVYCDISDQPENVQSKPVLTINESAPISATDASKTDGAIIPTGTSKRSK